MAALHHGEVVEKIEHHLTTALRSHVAMEMVSMPLTMAVRGACGPTRWRGPRGSSLVPHKYLYSNLCETISFSLAFSNFFRSILECRALVKILSLRHLVLD